MKLPIPYYQSSDIVMLARDLIGKHLFTQVAGIVTAGMITETEAYAGINDRASHAFGGRRTERTKVMYREGGCCYVYLCYGMHHLFNIVTGKEEEPHAVLIRGIVPSYGVEHILRRTGNTSVNCLHYNGPGKLSKALGISVKQNGTLLSGNTIWIEDQGNSFEDEAVLVSERIGVHYAGEDAKLPYRFSLKTNYYPEKKERLDFPGAL